MVAGGAWDNMRSMLREDRIAFRDRLLTEDSLDPNSLGQALIQNLRTFAENDVLKDLRHRAFYEMTDAELSEAALLPQQHLPHQQAPEDFVLAAKRVFEEEGQRRSTARASLASFYEALKRMQTSEELEAYLRAHPEFQLCNHFKKLMNADMHPFNVHTWVPNTMTFPGSSTHLKELNLEVVRLCKHPLLQKTMQKMARNPLHVDTNQFITLFEHVFEGDAAGFYADIKAGFDMGYFTWGTSHYPMEWGLLLSENISTMARGLQALDPIRFPQKDAAAEKLMEGIFRKVLLRDLILRVYPDNLVSLTMRKLDEKQISQAVVEEILPAFLSKVTDSKYLWTVKMVQQLRNTAWETMAMQVAVQRHAPQLRPDKRQRTGYPFIL